ncbi:MAG TPA: hypothetical protein VE422_20840 [Terriglobia bacterium]|nr:hypothetical protein [Terriglobia bacterium]
MWLGPVLYLAVSVFLWWYAGAVFVPLLMTRSMVRALPVLEDLQLWIIINAGLIYFGGYLVFAMCWQRLKPYLRNAFVAGLVLWLVNVLVVFPMMGRGVLGYMLPQGWMSASFPLLVSHWLFARGLQLQETRR